MANNTSPHILNTSATLLGFCLFIITSLHISNVTETHFIDGLTSIVSVLLTFSCMFSFVSIRTISPEKERKLETIADYFFFTALIGILVSIVIITINFIW
jgi:tetrahydromethanopterin S-methyltransferase subunit C